MIGGLVLCGGKGGTCAHVDPGEEGRGTWGSYE